MLIFQTSAEFFTPPRVVVPKPKAGAPKPESTAAPIPYPPGSMHPSRQDLIDGRVQAIEIELKEKSIALGAYSMAAALTRLTNRYRMDMSLEPDRTLLEDRQHLITLYSDPTNQDNANPEPALRIGPISKLNNSILGYYTALKTPTGLLDDMRLSIADVPLYMWCASQAYASLCVPPASIPKAAELIVGWAYAIGGVNNPAAAQSSPALADVQKLLTNGSGTVRAPPQVMERLIRILPLFVQERTIEAVDGVTPPLTALSFPATRRVSEKKEPKRAAPAEKKAPKKEMAAAPVEKKSPDAEAPPAFPAPYSAPSDTLKSVRKSVEFTPPF